jgi:WD40 repeat protein
MVDNQQVGLVWEGDFLVSLSLCGNLNYWDPRASQNPTQVVIGHQRGITSLDKLDSTTLLSGSYDGKILLWPKLSGISSYLPSLNHTNQITGFSVHGKYLASTGMDDMVKTSLMGEGPSIVNTASITSPGIPKGVAAFGDFVAFITINQNISITKNGSQCYAKNLEYTPSAVAFSINGSELLIGSTVWYFFLTLGWKNLRLLMGRKLIDSNFCHG